MKLVLALLSLTPLLAAQDGAVAALVDPQLPGLVATYKDLHRHPELSQMEEHTAAFLAGELRKAGYEVTDHFGKYADGKPALGVIAVLKNGPGPVVMVRTDMDALPVEEKTGVDYSSKEPGVMHACGHDIHMTALLGTARTLVQLKSQWHGTLILIGQPAEERISGARAMLNAGFYPAVPKPTYILALHDDSTIAAGKVGVNSGPILASANVIDVTIRGVGGHGAAPEMTKDPVVMAAQYVLAIQTIVSRQTSPLDPAVVTVGSIHGGTKHNIIPDEVHLQLSVRAYSEQTRESILSSLSRTARGVAIAAGVPEDRMPIVEVNENEGVPPTYNDPDLARRLTAVWVSVLGKDKVVQPKPMMASEDFGLFGLPGHEIPIFMLRVGAVAPEKLAESERTGKALPSLHSSLFAPAPEPTIRTGVIAMTAAALDLMK